MRFYISSKAAESIYINNVQLPNHDPDHLDTESRYWGELRHNDVVTVWWNHWVQKEFTRFRFECLWGASRDQRWDQEFTMLEPGPMLDELEQVCLREEQRMLEDRNKREQDEKDDKLREELNRASPVKMDQQNGFLYQHRNPFSASAPILATGRGEPVNYHQSFSFRAQDA